MPASTVLALLTGLLAGAAVIAAVAAFRPVSPDLGDTLYRLHHPSQTEQLQDGRPGDRLGRWLMVRSGVFGGFAVPYADLDLLGMTPARFFTAKAIFATAGLVLPPSQHHRPASPSSEHLGASFARRWLQGRSN